jgi:hypothetical protein
MGFRGPSNSDETRGDQCNTTNRLFADLQGVFEAYDAFNGCDSLGTVVVKETLEKLFVLDAIHRDAGMNVPVRLGDGVEKYLVEPAAFTITSFDITDYADRYEIELTAAEDERGYTYEFAGEVRRTGEPPVRVRRAKLST